MINSNFKLSEVTHALGLENQQEILSKHWNSSCGCYSDDIFFLKEEFITAYNKFFGFPENVLSVYKSTVNEINKSSHLKLLFWHMHQILFTYKDAENAEALLASWPRLETSLGELSDMFGVVVFASGITTVQKYYIEKGIPEHILLDTLDDLLRWINAFYKKHGRFGFNEFRWLYRHFTGGLFRLGRLQFESISFSGNIIVYKNELNGNIIVYSKPDIKYRKDGQVDGTSGIFDADGSWTSSFIKKDSKIYGNAITGNGCCNSTITEISEDEWSMVLNENDMVLNVHIPEGSKLDHEQCTRSYTEALAFFKQYFSDIGFKAFVCFSWLLDIQLKDILPPVSNMVQFLNDFVIFPVYSPREAQVYERVFGKYFDDVNKLPEGTFLQKAVKEYVRAGNVMRNGAGFILIEN